MAESIGELEKIITQDPGNRGVPYLHTPGGLQGAANDLLKAKSVGICTGFYIPAAGAGETDGPPGAIALARILLSLGKSVTLVTDESNAGLVNAAARITGLEDKLKPTIVFPNPSSDQEADLAATKQLVQNIFFVDAISVGDSKGRADDVAPPAPTLQRKTSLAARSMKSFRGLVSVEVTKEPRFDHLVAIERPSKAADGRYYNMKGEDISAHVGRVDELFSHALEHATSLSSWQMGATLRTTGIGDGGNEIGMAVVKDKVEQFVKHGSKIAAAVPTDNLIVSGVSNWGGYALAAAIYLLSEQPLSPDVLLSAAEEEALLEGIISAGGVDGATREKTKTVDGISPEKLKATIEKIREIALKKGLS